MDTNVNPENRLLSLALQLLGVLALVPRQKAAQGNHIASQLLLAGPAKKNSGEESSSHGFNDVEGKLRILGDLRQLLVGLHQERRPRTARVLSELIHECDEAIIQTVTSWTANAAEVQEGVASHTPSQVCAAVR